jgi:hypothetical protein
MASWTAYGANEPQAPDAAWTNDPGREARDETAGRASRLVLRSVNLGVRTRDRTFGWRVVRFATLSIAHAHPITPPYGPG